MAIKVRENISLRDAMANLGAIASIDLNAPGPIGILKGSRIVVDTEEFPGPEVEWLSAEGSEAVLEILDATFRAVQGHLSHLIETSEIDFEDPEQTSSLAAMMALTGECAIRMEKYLAYRLGRPISKIAERKEYLSLRDYYDRFFSEKIQANEPHETAEMELGDIEVVRRDQDYELFYIRHEDGTPYYKSDLLRHVRLNCDFSTDAESFEEDPLLRVRAMSDRDLHVSAMQVLLDCKSIISELYENYRKVANTDLAANLSQAVLALFLASNPRNLQQNTVGKSCLNYFEDFHYFLRRALHSDEYQKWIAYPPEKSERHAYLLLDLAHMLCQSFFHRAGGVKQEAIGLIHRTMRKGTKKSKAKEQKGESNWNQLLLDDENFRALLAKFPNGPLFKILDLVRQEQEENQSIAFDPVAQGNLPSKLYSLDCKGESIQILRIPAPIKQAVIDKAEIIEEFRGFLRSYSQIKPQRKLLMINLQDRNSWHEASRCHALEALQKNAEFSHALILFGLPKATPFYHQSGEFESLHRFDEFSREFLNQVSAVDASGFYLPPQFKQGDLKQFAKTAIDLIHRHFFEGKNTLTRQMREEFVEIFYHLLVLKLIDVTQPDAVSFTCKDAVDTGAAASASFFAFVKLLGSGMDAAQDQDYFRWLLYTPALFVRERAINPERLNRVLSMLERMESALAGDSKKAVKELGELYSPQFFKSLKGCL